MIDKKYIKYQSSEQEVNKRVNGVFLVCNL